jgi:conjugal transfer pilus assembly protein TraB
VPEPTKLTDRKAIVKHLLMDADPRTLGIEGLATQLKQVTQRNEELLRRLSSLEDQQKRTQQTDEERLRKLGEAQTNTTQGQLDDIRSQLETLRRDQQRPDSPGATPAAAPAPSSQILPNAPNGTTPSVPDSLDIDNLFGRAAPPPLYGGASSSSPGGKSSLEIRVIRTEPDKNPATKSANRTTPSSPSTSASHSPDGSEVFIPAGTLLTGNLLNGLDAPTGKGARKEPFPVLARIKQEAILPNRFRADLRECFLIAAGYGDLSAERAYLRAETLSCVRQDGGVIEVPIDAYAVGEDGKLGLRGTIVSKQGQLMANALLITGGAGAVTQPMPFQSAFSEQALQGGALKGAGYSMDRLAHYYMDLAENLFPVVEIDATRPIEFVVQRGTLLKLYNPKDTGNNHLSTPRQR